MVVFVAVFSLSELDSVEFIKYADITSPIS